MTLPRSLFGVAATIAFAGCSQAGDADSSAQAEERSALQARLARIASECSLPAASLSLNADGGLLIDPPDDASYESVDCALGRLRQAGLLNTMAVGFVGRETYSTVQNHAQTD